jgi:hypothetical protein
MKKKLFLCMAIFLIVLLTAGISLISCGGGGGSGSSGVSTDSTSTGSVAVLIADSPTNEYQNIWLTITEVSLIPVNDGAPVVIFQSAAGLKVDLLEYRDEDYLLRVKRDVPAGQYSKIRLRVSDIEVTPKDPAKPPPCANLEIKLPSGKIDLNPRDPFTVSQGGNLSIRLDIDANKSINLHTAGKSGKCIFRPVVFVDIEEGMPIGRCPKILSGKIISLSKDSVGNVVGFTLDLRNSQGTVDVSLLANAAIVNESGECKTPNDLKVGDEVRVRGKLAGNLVFEASNVVIGDLLDVVGTVVTDAVPNGSNFSFTFNPSFGEELTGGPYTVTVQACTLVLMGCDTTVDPLNIKAGMSVRIFGKLFSAGGSTILRAAAIVLKGQEITGIITNIVPQTGGQDVTVKQADDTLITFFVPNGMKIYLEGDGEIPANLLCVGREVRVFVNTSSTATLVKVMSEAKEGTVTAIDAGTRTLTVDLGGGITDMVVVNTGATILKSIGGVQSLISFGDIKVGSYIQYFGLTGCGSDTKFYAFVVVTE